jgi:nitrite reductase/ring-hydroxylating ferredoxin subunit
LLVEVARLDDLPEAVPTPVLAGERDLVLVRWRDQVYALRDLCPHMSKSFELGSVLGRPTGEVGSIAFDGDDPIMTCPWHQYEYSLTTGRCLTDRILRVRRYPVTIDDDGAVRVDLGAPVREPAAS